MMTSRAEYRLILRQDNADMRLTEKSHAIGLASDERMARLERKRDQLSQALNALSRVRIRSNDIYNEETAELIAENTSYTGAELVARGFSYDKVREFAPELPKIDAPAREQTEISLRYEGYISRQQSQIAQFRRLESHPLPADFDYSKLEALRLEARQKLSAIRPLSIGQASRISGVSPADIQVLLVAMRHGQLDG